jgi:tetratricopeptide (TPR) repeat protein
MSMDILQEVEVFCDCGYHEVISKAVFTEYVTCGSCGKKLYLTPRNTKDAAPDRSLTVFRLPDKPPVSGKLADAIALVRSNKFGDAAKLYRAIVEQDRMARDAWYGLGYCYYKMGQFAESKVLLDKAVNLGHKSAAALLQKVEMKLFA